MKHKNEAKDVQSIVIQIQAPFYEEHLPRRNMSDPVRDVAIIIKTFSSQTARIPNKRPVAP